MKRIPIAALVLLLTSPGVTLAQSISKEQKRAAESHTDAGVKHYNLGRFDEAIVEFQKAYDAVPHPTLLFNLGKAQWRSGAPEKAVFSFRRYLQMAPPDDPDRPGVEKRIKEIEATIEKDRQKASARLAPSPPTEATTRKGVAETPPAVIGQYPAASPTIDVQRAGAGQAPHDERFRLTISAGVVQRRFSVPPSAARSTELSSANLFSASGTIAYVVPLSVGALDIGVLGTWSPLPYVQMGARQTEAQSNLVGMLGIATLRLKTGKSLSIGPTVAAGAVWWTGLGSNNPFTGGKATGLITMPSARGGVVSMWHASDSISIGVDVGVSYSRPSGDLVPQVVSSLLGFEAKAAVSFGL